jgi:hypothetical protein
MLKRIRQLVAQKEIEKSGAAKGRASVNEDALSVIDELMNGEEERKRRGKNLGEEERTDPPESGDHPSGGT